MHFFCFPILRYLRNSRTPSRHRPSKKPAAAAKNAKTRTSTLEQQIEELRQQLQNQAGQIDSLKTGMAAKDEQLKHAEQAAANAQAAAEKAEAATRDQVQAETENATAVNSLRQSVAGLNSQQASLATTVTSETATIKKAIENPAALRYKGITLTPYGFLAGESAFRTHATGGQLVTPWSSLPYEGADEYSVSEMNISGTQSRVGFIAEGKVRWGTMRGIVEGDFLGAGSASNDNQSTSYLFRQRILAAEAETNSHWTFSGGQGWSLTAENKTGVSIAPTNIALPTMIDPNYVAGLVWSRMGFLRVTKSFGKATLAVSAENPQLLYTASLAGNTPYAVIGSAAASGSALNNAISACSPSTTIVNYTNQAQTDSAGNTSYVAVPVYKTVNSCTNLANISFNKSPDVVIKAAFDPGFGHYEVFAVGRTFQETIYPGETTNSNLYGGYKDIATGQVIAPALSTAGAYNHSVYLGGLGGSIRVPVIKDKFSFGGQGALRAGRRTLRRHKSFRCNVQRQRRAGAHPQPHRPAHSGSEPYTSSRAVCLLRRRLCRPRGRSQLLSNNPGRASRGVLRLWHGNLHHQPHCGADCRWRKLGRSLGGTNRRSPRLWIAVAIELRLQQRHGSGLQRRINRLLRGRILRRANARRAGRHAGLLVRSLQGRARPPAPGHSVQLRGA